MKLQQEKAIYFVHKDVQHGRIFRDPWVERSIEQGEIFVVKGPEIEFKIRGKTLKRRIRWLTNSREAQKAMIQEKGNQVLERAKKGVVRQAVVDRRIRNEEDRYISYAVDEEDWEMEEETAWDDVSGTKLDPEKVKEARKERGVP